MGMLQELEKGKVVSLEMATKDANRWFFEGKRGRISEKNKLLAAFDEVIENIEYGVFVVNADNSISQTLQFPINGTTEISVLNYKNRVKTETIHMHLQGVKADNADGRLLAHLAAATGTPAAVLQKMDLEDKKISDSLVVFFV